MPRPSRPPPGFTTLGSGIYVNLAPTTDKVADDSSPNVILIFGWMGAQTRHLEHYSRKYTELYPQATQIIIKCGSSFIWTSDHRKQNRLFPVIKVLENLGCLPSTKELPRIRPRVLVHSFSNGGGIQLTSLAHLLSSRYPAVPSSGHLTSALIMDSAPSISDFRTIGLAFSIAIRNPVARYVVLAFIYVMHAIRLALKAVFGWEMMSVQYVKALFQPRLFPWMNSQTPRLYIFSKKDELVPWQAVQQHAHAAKASGLNVRCEVYEGSAHVAHMRLDPERYWASIQDVWKAACREGEPKVAETLKILGNR